MPNPELAQRAVELIGRRGPPSPGVEEVNASMIRHWCEMVEDANPVYWDEEYAKGTRFGRLISPPHMAHTWNMRAWWRPEYLRPPKAPAEPDPSAEVLRLAEEMGYVKTVAVTNEAEYLAPYGPGDGRLIAVRYVSAITLEKRTRMGRGVFITTMSEQTTEKTGVLVASARMVLFKYAPG